MEVEEGCMTHLEVNERSRVAMEGVNGVGGGGGDEGRKTRAEHAKHRVKSTTTYHDTTKFTWL